MENNLLRRIKADWEFMSGVEGRIARLILSEPLDFTSLSLARAAEAANVSQGSVVNFATKYAGGGFPALKLAVAAACAERRAFSVAEEGTQGAVFRRTVENAEEALRNTLSLNTEETLMRVAERIRKAKKVEIYGVFRSAVVATDFYYQLLQLGVPANFVSDVLTCAVSASLLREDSLVIAISSSGQTKDIIDAVTLAKAGGVPVVAITAHGASPLARLSDEVLIAAPCGNTVSASAVEIRLSQLAITDALCAHLCGKLDAEGKKDYFKMSEILNSHNVKD